jgi:predicted phosphodiesterase
VVLGPFPSEVFDLLASLPDVRFVRGNTDRLVVERDREYGGLGAWCADKLGDERLAAISEWPLTLELDLEGVGRTLFCHAVPHADDPIFTRVTPDAVVIELLGRIDADVLVCGHTHVQFDRLLTNGPRVVNAGSVGMPYEGSADARWVLLGPDGVELLSTPYDAVAALDDLSRTGFPLLEQWLAPVLRAEVTAAEATAEFERRRRGA